MKFEEQKARDALDFEPLPDCPWLTIGDDCIIIKTMYSERLSQRLRNTGGRWNPGKRQWEFKFSQADRLREAIPRINELAAAAQGAADEETRRREAEKQRRADHAERRRQEQEKKDVESRPAALQVDYLVAQDGPMYALTLEAIGDDTNQMYRRLGGCISRHFVAQIMGRDGRGRWTRAFLQGQKDYKRANSKGSRGVMVTYLLEQGPIYEVKAPISWSENERYFARVADGKIQRMTKQEVEECLAR